MDSLYDKLVQYSNSGYYPMHMPGHKRNSEMLHMVNPYQIDITEIEGFDNLHDANDIIKDIMDRAARIYHSETTHLLVNGSTVGILAAISACTQKGDKILVARNCHKSVYNAIFLNELHPIYIYPQILPEYGVNGGISPQKVKEMLISEPDIKGVVLTSPTYEGIVSDVKCISEIVHRHGIPLIIDEAHGAHFGFHKDFPDTSIENGADIVIHSIHKTLPSFTQTALMHVNGRLVDKEKIKQYLSIYQSSSPSYILMASMDQCIGLLEKKSSILFDQYAVLLSEFRSKISKLKNIKLMDSCFIGTYDIFDYDRSKIVLSVKGSNMTGKECYDMLFNQFQIQMEQVAKDYILGMTSICDTKEGFLRFYHALLTIDDRISKRKNKTEEDQSNEKYNINQSGHSEDCNNKNLIKETEDDEFEQKNIILMMALSSYQVYNKDYETIPMEMSIGRISYEYAYLYPPGIPLIVPGEIINNEIIEYIKGLKNSGLMIKGMSDHLLKSIKVVKENIV